MTKYCPKCGQKPAETRPFVEGFCIHCYFQQHPLVSLRRTPTAKICPRCHSYYTSGKWIHPGTTPKPEYLHQMVCDLLDPLFSPSQPATFEVQLRDLPANEGTHIKEVQVEVTAKAQDLPYEEKATISVPVSSSLCEKCKQMAGGYYEAIIQLRAAAGTVTSDQEEQVLTFISQRFDEMTIPLSSIKVEESRGGVDIRFVSGRLARSLAKELAEKFGLLHRVSSKVAGRSRDGKTLRRDSYSLRFPPYTLGDVISDGSRVFIITGIRNGQYIQVDLESGHRKSLTPKDLTELEWDDWNDRVQTFQVISEEGGVYQLLSQADFTTIYDITSSEYPLIVGSLVRAIEWKNQLFLLPEPKEQNQK